MPIHISACSVPAVQFAPVVCCVLICTFCAAYIAYAFHTSHVMSVMIPWSYLSQVLGRVITMRLCAHVTICLGNATIALGIMGCAPLECDLSVLIKIHAASHLCSHRLRTQAHSDSQTEQLQRAGHKPALCLVLWTRQDCTLQESLDTHSEGFLLC